MPSAQPYAASGGWPRLPILLHLGVPKSLPPPTKITLQPGESPFLAAAREVARNPDSPASLKIMSAISQSMAPRQAAVNQVLQAMEEQLREDGPSQRAAVDAAIGAWERICGTVMDNNLQQQLREDAASRARQRRRQPPAIDTILTVLPNAPTDTGYDLGVHMDGIKGTWHRLWGIICLSYSFGNLPDQDDAVSEVRNQFERILGRGLSPQEWQALADHARRHYEAEMMGKLSGL